MLTQADASSALKNGSNIIFGCFLVSQGLIVVLYYATAAVLSKFGKGYENLEASKKAVTLSQAAQVVFWFFAFAPYNYFTAVILLDLSGSSIAFTGLVLLGICQVCLYATDLGVRSLQEVPRPGLLAHHAVAAIELALVLFVPNPLNVESAAILGSGASWELFLYAGLVHRRVCTTRNIWTSRLILFGLVIFSATRILQMVEFVFTLASHAFKKDASASIFYLCIQAALVGASLLSSVETIVTYRSIFKILKGDEYDFEGEDFDWEKSVESLESPTSCDGILKHQSSQQHQDSTRQGGPLSATLASQSSGISAL